MEFTSSNRIDRDLRRENDSRQSPHNRNASADHTAQRTLSHRPRKPERYPAQRLRRRSSSSHDSILGDSPERTAGSENHAHECFDQSPSPEEVQLKESHRHIRGSEALAQKEVDARYPPPTKHTPRPVPNEIAPQEDYALKHSAQSMRGQKEYLQERGDNQSNPIGREQQGVVQERSDSRSTLSSEDRHKFIRTHSGEHKNLRQKDSHKQRGQAQSPENPLREARSNLTGLPERFPTRLNGKLAWTAHSIAAQRNNVSVRLSHQDTVDIDKALKTFLDRRIARGLVSPQTFRLPPSVRQLLADISHEVYSGCGFKILEGLDLSTYSELQRVILFAGLTSYIADIRANYNDHVQNKADGYSGTEKLIPPLLDIEMQFHTDVDVFDMLALFTLSTAERGGDQQLASMTSIYNILATEDPKVLQTLSQDWYWERKLRQRNGEEQRISMKRPIIAIDDCGRIQINYSGAMVGANPKYPLSREAPALSDDQAYALKKLNEVARRVSIRITPRAGNILFLNNYAILHARDSWKDSPQKKRHLIRSWFHNTRNGWKSAPELQRRTDIFDLPPEKQMLLTSTEWDKLHRATETEIPSIIQFCHD